MAQGLAAAGVGNPSNNVLYPSPRKQPPPSRTPRLPRLRESSRARPWTIEADLLLTVSSAAALKDGRILARVRVVFADATYRQHGLYQLCGAPAAEAMYRARFTRASTGFMS